MPILFFFIFGTIIGSFLNVIILRYNTGRKIFAQNRSHCPKCRYQLAWFDMVPVLSWIFLRGKCRKCHAKISIQYPLVEFFTGITFVGIFGKFFLDGRLVGLIAGIPLIKFVALTSLIFEIVIVSLLIIIFVYDLRHKIIPDGLSFSFAGIALLLQILFLIPFLMFGGNWETIVTLNLLAGPILALPFYLIWKLSRGRAMGLGDGKLALGIGWFLGFILGLNAIVVAFWVGAIIALCIMLIDRLKNRGRHITMKSEIPFAPFLIFGTIIEFLWNFDWIGIGIFFR